MGFRYMLRALRHARHALARVSKFQPALRVIITEQPHGFLVIDARHAERRRNSVGSDIVMGGAYPA